MGEASVGVIHILTLLVCVLVGIPDGLLLVWDCFQPARPQVVVEKFEFVLVLVIILMDGECVADSWGICSLAKLVT